MDTYTLETLRQSYRAIDGNIKKNKNTDVYAEAYEKYRCVCRSIGKIPMCMQKHTKNTDVYAEAYEKYRCVCRSIRKIPMCMQKHTKNTDVYAEAYEKRVQKTLSQLKGFITLAKRKRNEIRHEQMMAEQGEKDAKKKVEEEILSQKISVANLLVEEVFRLIAELNKEFSKSTVDVSDEELLRRKEDYPENSLQLERLSNKFQRVFQSIPEGFNMTVIKRMKDGYDKIIKKKRNI